MKQLVALVCLFVVAWCDREFSNYQFKSTLNADPLYELYWNFDNDAETISFAVRVETTGWVGLGLSPNGQMPNSDVVIGWVTDDGQTMFHDRFAAGRAPPTIDEQQDWTLISGEEEGGFTILEFSRKYITCDDNDLPITAETARVIWSLGNNDPSSADLAFSDIHSEKGSRSLNLLGGLPDAAPDPDDLQSYDFAVENITVPENDTTYWCAAFRLPQFFREQEKYVTKIGPRVTEGNEAHVHHLVMTLCEGINETHVGNGGECEEGVPEMVSNCRNGKIIAVWAVGGETFVFPDDVALPFGGEGHPEYILLELHYDNPLMKRGTIDSSGMTFWYTSTPRKYDAAVMTVGTTSDSFHVIPPNTRNFVTTTIVPSTCTSTFIPEDGIHVFANFLHTHIVGHGLTVQHIRYNSECDVYEELKPIDQNLKYDFDYQQTTHLPQEVIVKPGDILQLKCFYNTDGKSDVTFGGLSTRDEMCFSFLYYYPKIDLSIALSLLYPPILTNYINSKQQTENTEDYKTRVNSIDWEKETDSFQNLVDNSTQVYLCFSDKGQVIQQLTSFTNIGCSYIAPDQCSDSSPPSCCERITGTMATTEGTEATESAGLVKTSVSLLVLSLLTTIFG